ncbi:MAG: sensor domain-containing diguanylate cyclase [Coxiellaceae bacterium]|nr:sensor domain-containing diguanylate cyclase [Coxiellaceae bacterium]
MSEDSKALYESVFKKLPIGAFIVKKDRKIIAWNHWLEEKTKITEEKAIGHDLCELFPGFKKQRFDWALDQVLQHRIPQILSQTLNHYLIPIELSNPTSEHLRKMQQHVRILPIIQGRDTCAMVFIIDETNSVRQKMMLMRLGHELEEQSIRDALTKAYNRRFLWEWMDSHFQQAKRDKYQIACCLFDIDFFKKINDKYGHDAGDQVLIDFVNLISTKVRGLDLVVRYGGEEFIAMIDKADEEKAMKLAGRIRSLIESSSLNHFPPKAITCSVGVSLWDPENAVDGEKLIEQADKALYQAKEAGRNCVKLAK